MQTIKIASVKYLQIAYKLFTSIAIFVYTHFKFTALQILRAKKDPD